MADVIRGYIQPTPATAPLWADLLQAKQRCDFVEVGRLSALIRTETIRNGHNDDVSSGGNSGHSYDGVVAG